MGGRGAASGWEELINPSSPSPLARLRAVGGRGGPGQVGSQNPAPGNLTGIGPDAFNPTLNNNNLQVGNIPLDLSWGKGLKSNEPDYEVSTTGGVTVVATDPARLNTLSQQLFGYTLSPRDYAALVAAPPGARVELTASYSYRGDTIQLSIKHPLYDKQERTLYRNPQGELELHHSYWRMSNQAPAGTARQVFWGVVNAALKYKIQKITTMAAGNRSSSSFNGYYTWARFGFNGSLSQYYRASLPESLKPARNLNQLMLMPGGAEWWKEHGEDQNLTFYVRPGSSSLRVWLAYLKEKHQQKGTTQ